MRFHFFIQSFSQLNNVYGKDISQIILDNCGLVYLKTNTQETAEEISKRLGKKTIESNSISQSMSLTRYDGNKSTSLISRDLMTPDEVKQLHYKTIIFPIIGYPIIRDTVVYKKFKSYSSGEVVRDINPLLDLSNTYFTVEQIKTDNNSNNGNNRPVPTELEEYEDIVEYDKTCLKDAEQIIKKLLKKENYKYDYEKNDNNRVYGVVTLNRKLLQIDKSKIKVQIDNNKYEVKIEDNEINQTVISIYNKPIDLSKIMDEFKEKENNV